MKPIRIITYGALPEGCTIYAATAEEAVEGWARQLSEPLGLMIEVAGFETEESFRAPCEVNELHVLPRMYGGGGKFGQFIIAAVMVGISFIPGIGPAVVAGLRIAAGVAALNGVIALFMKAPTVSREADPEASKYIGSGQNTTAIGTIIGMGGGRMLVGGHYLSIAVDAQDLVYGKYPTTP